MSKLDIQLAAGYIKRYHIFPIIGEQTVGTHSYGVAQFVRALTEEKCSIELLKAALDHDVAEQITGDMPHISKVDYPELDEAISSVEEKVEIEYDLRHELTLHEKGLLRLADLLEAGFFGLKQVNFGNDNATVIIENVLNAIEKLEYTTPIGRRLTKNLEDMYHECKR